MTYFPLKYENKISGHLESATCSLTSVKIPHHLRPSLGLSGHLLRSSGQNQTENSYLHLEIKPETQVQTSK